MTCGDSKQNRKIEYELGPVLFVGNCMADKSCKKCGGLPCGLIERAVVGRCARCQCAESA